MTIHAMDRARERGVAYHLLKQVIAEGDRVLQKNGRIRCSLDQVIAILDPETDYVITVFVKGVCQ